MATLSPQSSIARQPFGLLDGGRLRNLSNVKNTQNGIICPLWSRLNHGWCFAHYSCVLIPALAISTLPSTSLKRRYEAPIFEDVDSENVDPSVSCSPTKKNKIGLQESFQPSKASKFVMNSSANMMKSSLDRPVRSVRRSDPIATRSHQQKLGERRQPPLTRSRQSHQET